MSMGKVTVWAGSWNGFRSTIGPVEVDPNRDLGRQVRNSHRSPKAAVIVEGVVDGKGVYPLLPNMETVYPAPKIE